MANAYYAGSVGSFADLKTALETALVAEGWTVSSGILSKGAGFFRLESATAYLRLSAGAGQSGSSLADAAPGQVQIGSFTTSDPISWPIGYEIHINEGPDEVYCVINHSVDRYQNLSFGVSPAPGNTSGLWINGTGGQNSDFGHVNTGFDWVAGSGTQGNSAPAIARGNVAYRLGAGILSCFSPGWAGRLQHYVRLGDTWLPGTSTFPSQTGSLAGALYASGLLFALPSSFNQSLVLIPIYGVSSAEGNGVFVCVQLASARHCRIDNYEPGAVVEYGSDKWKVYPLYRKDAVNRSPGLASAEGPLLHTGTFGYAVRYHGD